MRMPGFSADRYQPQYATRYAGALASGTRAAGVSPADAAHIDPLLAQLSHCLGVCSNVELRDLAFCAPPATEAGKKCISHARVKKLGCDNYCHALYIHQAWSI
jgi:hypothetical protein